jgi:hypothetical protein
MQRRKGFGRDWFWAVQLDLFWKQRRKYCIVLSQPKLLWQRAIVDSQWLVLFAAHQRPTAHPESDSQ